MRTELSLYLSTSKKVCWSCVWNSRTKNRWNHSGVDCCRMSKERIDIYTKNRKRKNAWLQIWQKDFFFCPCHATSTKEGNVEAPFMSCFIRSALFLQQGAFCPQRPFVFFCISAPQLVVPCFKDPRAWKIHFMRFSNINMSSPSPVLGKLLQKRNALFITCYCHFKVISYITVLLSLNCKALHYFYITFALLSPK